MAADREASAACWTASTSWITAHGSLCDAISFESSASDAPAPISGGLLLVRPPSDDPPPCRVTVCFREKHEIHRVYVRSTARVYEIYYSSGEQSNSKEYLCTVHCGAASEEMKLPSEADGTTECQIGKAWSTVLPDQVTKGASSTSDEDGWVEVKVPDPLPDEQANSLSNVVDKEISANLQVLYEATAEISDANACLSLTLLLLSLETKTRVNIEEIYIYADPVECTSSGSPISTGQSLAQNSLFTMLLPSLKQLPKSGSRRNLRDDPKVRKYMYDTEKAADTRRLDMEKPHPQETSSSITDWPSGLVCETAKVRPEKTQMTYRPNSVQEENNLAYTRVEKVLEGLVSRVERIEAFCARFEENMMKPISCIEGSLQRLEQQFDALSERVHSSKSFPSLKISVPEFSSDITDSEDKVCSPSHAAREDSKFADLSSPHTDVTASVPELLRNHPQSCPLLIIKVPEFSSEDENTVTDDSLDSVVEDCQHNNPSSFGSNLANTNSTLDPLAKDIPKNKKPSSVDSAIASALAELMSLTTTTSPRSPRFSPGLMKKSSSISHIDNNILASSSVGVTSELARKTLNNCDVENSDFGISCELKSFDFVHSSLSADAAEAPLFGSEMRPGLLITAPEFPSEHSDYINCIDNSSDSEVNYGLCTSGLAAYLSSSMASSTSESVVKTLNNFSVEDNGSGIFNEAKSTDFVDSPMPGDVVQAPLFDSEMCAELLIAPEFPSEHGDYINCDNRSSDPDVKNNLSILGLAAYLSLSTTKSASHNQFSLNVTLEGSNVNDNKSASTSVQFPCEADKLDMGKHGSTVNQVVHLDSTFKFLLPKGIPSREEMDAINHRYGSTEVPAVGSSSNSTPPGDSLEQQVCNNKWHEKQIITEPTEMRIFADGFLHSKFKKVNQKLHDGECANDGDAEETAHRDRSLNLLSTGWVEGSTLYSSVDETFLRNEVQFDRSYDCSTDSTRISMAVDELNGEDANIHTSSQAIAHGFVGHGVVDEPFAGDNHENSKSGMKLLLESMSELYSLNNLRADLAHEASTSQDYEYSILDVKFAQESNCKSEDSLEVLLGATLGAEEQAFADNADDGGVVNIHEKKLITFQQCGAR